jgi:hypothetical protein
LNDLSNITAQCENCLAGILGLAFHFIGTLRFDRNDVQQLICVCLYARIVELASACKALLEKNVLACIPIILRSMFEADIDLTNCMADKDYFERMNLSFLEKKRRLTEEANPSKNNPFLRLISQVRNVKQDLAETQKEIATLSRKGFYSLSIRKRAKQAGKLNEYLSVYNFLCLDTHNNIRALEYQHIQAKSKDQYQVVVFGRNKSDFVEHSIAISDILLSQTKAVNDFMKIEGIDFEKYFSEYKQLQDAVKLLGQEEME